MQIYANLCKFMQIYAMQNVLSSKNEEKIPYLRFVQARVDRGAGHNDATETG